MSVESIFGVLVTAALIGFVMWPLVRRITRHESAGTVDPTVAVERQRALVYQALMEIDLDYRSGKLSEEDYRAQMERGLASAAALLAEGGMVDESKPSVEPGTPSMDGSTGGGGPAR